MLTTRRGDVTEAERAKLQLGDFKCEGSIGERFVINFVGYPPTRLALISLAIAFSEVSGVPLNRDSYRLKPLLIKWFDDNHTKIAQFQDMIKLEM